MTSTLYNRIHPKGRLFGFKMLEEKAIDDNHDEFNKIIIDLENLVIEIDNEDKAILILNSLPKKLKKGW